MTVCHCHGVSERRIRSWIRRGIRSRRGIARACGAGSSCGGCLLQIDHLLEIEKPQPEDVHAAPAAVAAR